MIYNSASRLLPAFLRDYVLHFEAAIQRAVDQFASGLPDNALVLDAGAGESQHAPAFRRQRYIGVDLGIGDAAWNYGSLSAMADLLALPFGDQRFDAAISIVTLEHVTDPQQVLREMARVLKPGAQVLIVVPHEWEVHQSPHDFFRYTRHGLQLLLTRAGLADLEIQPVGGFFRLLSRRLFNALQFFPGPLFVIAALFLAPPALLAPVFDWLDRRRDFTLGYICTARKP
ncbi:MAG: class I SAM-dependent methyltransferase [Acidobacteria bacterium]|nr:class I SAM-dependent methyltransferase [Acidobacteriota bacterium]